MLGMQLDLEPMKAKLVSELLKNAGWQCEPKWNGFRCLAFRSGDEVGIQGQVRKIAIPLLSRGAKGGREGGLIWSFSISSVFVLVAR